MPRRKRKYYELPLKKSRSEQWCRICSETIPIGEKHYGAQGRGSVHERCGNFLRDRKIRPIFRRGYVWIETDEEVAKLYDDDVRGKLGWLRNPDEEE